MFRNIFRATLLYVALLKYVFAELKFECKDFVNISSLIDTTELNTTLFSISGLKELKDCLLMEYGYFEIKNDLVVLNKSLTDYCGDLKCGYTCDSGDAAIGLTQGNIGIEKVERLGNYTIKFTQNSTSITVTENIPINTTIKLSGWNTKIEECSHGELSSITQVIFHIKESPHGLFRWGPPTANDKMYVNKDIDYEITSFVSLVVQADLKLKSGGKPFSSAFATVNVYISDTDDNPPKFNFSRYNVSIPEEDNSTVNHPLHILPADIFAYDMDKGINEEIVYSILSPNISGLFRINSSTGEVFVTKPLNREHKEKYSILIKASQKDKAYSFATTTLFVNVIDVDDHLPVISPGPYTATLSEHSAAGSYIIQIRATDGDLGENAKFTFRLLNETVPVKIDDNGILRVKNQNEFDREAYKLGLNITVGTLTFDNRTGENNTIVTIYLDDINDNNPVFTNGSYHFTVENLTDSQNVGRVTATDEDDGPNANLTYSFMESTHTNSECRGSSEGGAFPFQINSISGNISLLPPSVLLCLRYRTFVKACDNPISSSSNSRCAVVEVFISASNASNRTSTSLTNQTFQIIENSVAGTVVGKVHCSGTDYTYSGSSSFQITSSGLLVTSESLDRETNDTHEGVVLVTDKNGEGLCRINVTINVLDANDNAPTFLKDVYSFEIANGVQGKLKLGRLSAKDLDAEENGDFTFFIKDTGDSSFFSINSSSGDLYLDSTADLTKDIYYLLVVASDRGTPKLESFASVYISKFDADNFTIPLSTPMTPAEVNSKKQQLEKDLSEILDMIISISKVSFPADGDKSKVRSVVHISGSKNSSAPVTKAEMQRALLRNYEAVRLLFYQGTEAFGNKSKANGLRAPEIALIAMAAVILIGASAAIIIINKQFNSHKKYRRLYENLTRNSSIYESQEIKIDLNDETSDYNGSLNTQDLEQTETKELESAAASVNPVYRANQVFENDSGNISDLNQEAGEETNDILRTRTDSEQAMDSLHRLSDLLDKEVDEDVLCNENSENLNPESGEKINAFDRSFENPADAVTESTTSSTGSVGEIYPIDITNDVRSKDIDNSTDNSNDLAENANLAPFSLDLNSTVNADNNNIDPDEPNPDYDIKQVRFSAEVLDTDDNKLEPLKENEGGRKLPKRIVNINDISTEQNNDKEEVDFNEEMNTDKTNIDQNERDFDSVQSTDEPGWVEEEINSPNNLMNLDDVEKAAFSFTEEDFTHF